MATFRDRLLDITILILAPDLIIKILFFSSLGQNSQMLYRCLNSF